MDHVKVAVDGEGGEEGDAGSPVEEEHGEHGFAHQLVLTAPLALLEVIGLGRKAHHQQEIGHHDIEEEDTVGSPELESEERESFVFTISSLFHC